MKRSLAIIAAIAAVSIPASAQARDQIFIVGSSTVYPFVTVVAEEFGNKTRYSTPIVETNGTGGGFKQFCEGVGEKHPDLSNASRAIKKTERELCAKNGVTDITELKIGYDGIVLANSKEASRYNLTKEQIFLALAEKIPADGKLVANPHQKWSDVDPSLPDSKIEVYGPPTTSGTRDAFVELVMEPACENLPAFKTAYPDKKERGKACQLIRRDGHYIDSGEDDNVIISKLRNNPEALGIFGFSYLDQNRNAIQGSVIENVEPAFENIADGSYGVARSLYVYAKDAHLDTVKGMSEFIGELVSSGALGEYGYLSEKGLIPMPAEELQALQAKTGHLLNDKTPE